MAVGRGRPRLQGTNMMTTATARLRQAGPALGDEPHFVFHPSFEASDAEQAYGGAPPAVEGPLGFMPDEATGDCTKRMHYAAWRSSRARSGREAAHWRRRYYDCRNRVVLGNRKLAFRAVQKWGVSPQVAD